MPDDTHMDLSDRVAALEQVLVKRDEARNDSRLLLTEDKDFGELLFRLKLAVPGLVLLRFRPEQHLLKWARLEARAIRR